MGGWKSRAFLAIRLFLGVLLLAAAALKIYGWSVSTIPPVGWFSTPAVQAVAVVWEILLSVWLLSGIVPLGSWLAAIATFVLLAGISGYLGWIGQATCGCFGTINASPWHAFAVDVAALVLLAVGRPRWRTIKTVLDDGLWRIVSPAVYFVLGVCLIVACSMGMSAWVYSSPEAALARLRGESVVVEPEYVDCGTGKPGEKLEAVVVIRNWSDRPVRVCGGTSDCSCIATRGLPITIPPRESRTIPVIMKLPNSDSGAFTRFAEIFTDCEQQQTIRFRVGCRVE